MRKYIQSQAEERAERVRNTRRQAQTSIAASHIHTTIMQSFSMILFFFSFHFCAVFVTTIQLDDFFFHISSEKGVKLRIGG